MEDRDRRLKAAGVKMISRMRKPGVRGVVLSSSGGAENHLGRPGGGFAQFWQPVALEFPRGLVVGRCHRAIAQDLAEDRRPGTLLPLNALRMAVRSLFVTTPVS